MISVPRKHQRVSMSKPTGNPRPRDQWMLFEHSKVSLRPRLRSNGHWNMSFKRFKYWFTWLGLRDSKSSRIFTIDLHLSTNLKFTSSSSLTRINWGWTFPFSCYSLAAGLGLSSRSYTYRYLKIIGTFEISQCFLLMLANLGIQIHV